MEKKEYKKPNVKLEDIRLEDIVLTSSIEIIDGNNELTGNYDEDL